MRAAGRKIVDVVELAHVVKKAWNTQCFGKEFFFNYINELLDTRDASRKLRR